MREQPPEVTAWLDDLGPDQREQAESLVRLVHDVGTPLSEAIKWRRLTFTVDDDWHHWLCQIAVTKKGTSLVFHKGVLLDDPANLLEGQGRYLRQVPYQRAVAGREGVTGLVMEALEHRQDKLGD
ncbi:MAG TPA: DUF1801 domain-containing protein [Egibacteraceae bacterium]|nr:DUF1801 domain-containing protein [Egibacteraceae bacterium]